MANLLRTPALYGKKTKCW